MSTILSNNLNKFRQQKNYTQEQVADMAKRSVMLNNLQNKINTF